MAKLELVETVADIDLQEWHEQGGVECLLLDVEGTIVPYGSTEVDPSVSKKIEVAKASGLISVVGLVSNKTDLGFLAEVGAQISADGIFAPKERHERKPSPTLVERAMREFEQTKQSTGMAGDKYTADANAAMAAELTRIAWNRRLGTTDHLGDRLLRRPYEAVTSRLPLSVMLGGSWEFDYPIPRRQHRS
jgi:predicted HAD superfamily phosphohydrolase YqeG